MTNVARSDDPVPDTTPGWEPDSVNTMTLEAFADTIIPGEKRHPDDRAIAGACAGGGAVASGAVPLMRDPAGGLDVMLEPLVEALNAHAREYAATAGATVGERTPFVDLAFADRTTLVQALVAPGHPEKELWVSLVMFASMAWDTGAYTHLVDALRAGHPGLTTMGFLGPDPDGLWRFPEFSYGRPLADLHPLTTSTGSPA